MTPLSNPLRLLPRRFLCRLRCEGPRCQGRLILPSHIWKGDREGEGGRDWESSSTPYIHDALEGVAKEHAQRGIAKRSLAETRSPIPDIRALERVGWSRGNWHVKHAKTNVYTLKVYPLSGSDEVSGPRRR